MNLPPKVEWQVGECHPNWGLVTQIIIDMSSFGSFQGWRKNISTSRIVGPLNSHFVFESNFWMDFFVWEIIVGSPKSRSKNTTHEKQINFIGEGFKEWTTEKDDGFWMHWEFGRTKNLISFFGAPFRGVVYVVCFWLSLPSVRVDEFPSLVSWVDVTFNTPRKN